MPLWGGLFYALVGSARRSVERNLTQILTTEAAIAKRLTRAKQKIREAKIAFEIPAGEELARRLDGVLQSLYLLFNEGYAASSGTDWTRPALCDEAMRLMTVRGLAATLRPRDAA